MALALSRERVLQVRPSGFVGLGPVQVKGAKRDAFDGGYSQNEASATDEFPISSLRGASELLALALGDGWVVAGSGEECHLLHDDFYFAGSKPEKGFIAGITVDVSTSSTTTPRAEVTVSSSHVENGDAEVAPPTASSPGCIDALAPPAPLSGLGPRRYQAPVAGYEATLVAYDAATGKVSWKRPCDINGGGAASAMLASDGVVVTACEGDDPAKPGIPSAVALDLTTGHLRWRTTSWSIHDAGVGLAPAAGLSLVALGGEAPAQARQLTSGTRGWDIPATVAYSVDTWVADPPPGEVIAVRTQIISATDHTFVEAFDALSGQSRWRIETLLTSEVAVTASAVVVTTADGARAVDPGSGEPKWQLKLPHGPSVRLLVSGHDTILALVPSGDAATAVDATTGRLIADLALDARPLMGAIATGNGFIVRTAGHLYFLDPGGHLINTTPSAPTHYAMLATGGVVTVDATRLTRYDVEGHLRWSLTLQAPTTAVTLDAHDALLLFVEGNNITAVDDATGQTRWTSPGGEAVVAPTAASGIILARYFGHQRRP